MTASSRSLATQENIMRHTWISKVGIGTLVGVMVLGAWLLLMPDRALADKGDKDNKGNGSATDLSGVTQNWDKNLTGTARFTVLVSFGGAAVRDNNTGWCGSKRLVRPKTPSWHRQYIVSPM
jgi:hypothetical protein